MSYTRGGASKEDQSAKVGGALVAESTSGVDQRSHTVGLHRASHERAAPCSCCASSFFRLDELLLRVRRLGAVVCVAENGSKDTQRSRVGEEGTHRNSGGLHRGQIYEMDLIRSESVLCIKLDSQCKVVILGWSDRSK